MQAAPFYESANIGRDLPQEEKQQAIEKEVRSMCKEA
jgi:hypothetical protein